MTNREFFNTIINTVALADDVKAYAVAELAKLDARNEKRRNTMTKEQLANEQVKVDILECLKNGALVASEIATACGISTQKASALCKQLVVDGKVTVADRKVKGKGAVKEYALADGE